MIPIASYYFLFKAALFPIGSYDSYSFLWPPIGEGAIPALPTADKIQSKCPAAARVGINPTPTLGKCDQCMNMYAKQTSRMISPSGSDASAGKGFMPFLKQCSTYF